jgi:hypothetical protein
METHQAQPYYYAKFHDGTEFSHPDKELFEEKFFKTILQGKKTQQHERIIDLYEDPNSELIISFVQDLIRNKIFYEIKNYYNESKITPVIVN